MAATPAMVLGSDLDSQSNSVTVLQPLASVPGGLFAKSSELVAHSTQHVDKVVLKVQNDASVDETASSAAIHVAAGCVGLVLVVTMWLLWWRRRLPPSPGTPSEDDTLAVHSDSDRGANVSSSAENQPIQILPRSDSSARATPYSRASSMTPSTFVRDSSRKDSKSPSLWSSLLRWTRPSRDAAFKDRRHTEEAPTSTSLSVVEIATPRTSTVVAVADSSSSSSLYQSPSRWSSTLLEFKLLKRATPTRGYV